MQYIFLCLSVKNNIVKSQTLVTHKSNNFKQIVKKENKLNL